VEFIQQRRRWDCGVACAAMLSGLLYDAVLPFFGRRGRRNGLFPDDILEILDDLDVSCQSVDKLPRRSPALVAIAWRKEGLSGHFVVWDPKRNQFLDPIYGLVDKDEMLRACRIEHIWSIAQRKMADSAKQDGQEE
jgi:hypothetical protein